MFCADHPKRVTCLRHACDEVCSCGKQIVCYYRYTDKVLSDAVRELRAAQRRTLCAETAGLIHAARKLLPTQSADPLLNNPNLKLSSLKRPLELSASEHHGISSHIDKEKKTKVATKPSSTVQQSRICWKQRRPTFVTSSAIVVSPSSQAQECISSE